MLRAIEGLGVLLLLSIFFAYLLAPAVAGVRRRVRTGGRHRRISRAAALFLLYLMLFVPAAFTLRSPATLSHTGFTKQRRARSIGCSAAPTRKRSTAPSPARRSCRRARG
jgi:hypothetical protein